MNNERVGSATKNLKLARLELNDAYQHLDKADEDVIEVIKTLNKILRESEEALTADLLLEQIRALIKRESFLRRETERWGKILLINEDEAVVVGLHDPLEARHVGHGKQVAEVVIERHLVRVVIILQAVIKQIQQQVFLLLTIQEQEVQEQ